jgi:hypothetical protein
MHLLQHLLRLCVSSFHFLLLFRNLLLDNWPANDLRAELKEGRQMFEEMLLLFVCQCRNILEARRMMVLGPPEVDDSLTDFHSIQHAQGLFSTRVVRELTESETTGVVFACLFDEVEALESSIPLQKVFDLVFGVLFG